MSWTDVRLESVCHKITDGSHNPPKGTNKSTYLMLSSKNIFNDVINFDNPRYLTKDDFEQENKRTDVSKNDVLLTIVGTIGRVAVVTEEQSKFTLQRSVAVLKPNTALIAPRFLMYTLISLSNVLNAEARGVAQKGIYLKQVRELKIPLPPLAEQQQIAAILDAADSVRQKDQQLIEHYTSLSQSLFLNMFGDPVINPMGWDILSIDEMTQFITSGSRGWAKYYSDNGDLFLRIQNVGKNQLLLDDVAHVHAPENAEARRTSVKSGDILLSITADLGRTAVIPDAFPKAHINQHLAIIRLKDDYEPLYVSEYVSSIGGKRQFLRLDKGGVKAGLNFADIKSLQIPNPPIELQRRYIETLRQIQTQKQQAQANLEKSEALFNSLLQRAFNGELTGRKAA